jgi:oxygen-dependent protoporphyrinogen oxidase
MAALEREHGSLFRAARRGKGPPSRGRLCSFAGGLAELPAAVTASLGDAVTLGAPVRRIARDGALWRAETDDGRVFAAAALALTTPAARTAELVAPLDARLADELAAIPYAPMAVVHVGVRREALPGLRPGFGFLVPRDEGLRILGALFSSELFEGRAPKGHALLTIFAGGRLDPAAPALGDAALRAFVLADLRRALGLAEEPSLIEVTRWPRAIPQYVVGHAERVERIEAAARAHTGLYLLGNWRGGIAMPDCVRNAEMVASTVCEAAIEP